MSSKQVGSTGPASTGKATEPAITDMTTTRAPALQAQHSSSPTKVPPSEHTLDPGDDYDSGANTPNWGEPISVARPLDTTSPDFPALQRALSTVYDDQRGSSDSTLRGDGGEFDLRKKLKDVRSKNAQKGRKTRKLDVAWKNLYVAGVGASAVYAPDMGSMFNPFTAIKDKRRAAALEAKAAKANPAESGAEAGMSVKVSSPSLDDAPPLGKNEKFLIQDFSGLLRSGEMALIIGRPGSGCTTFLKTLSNLHAGFTFISGTILYGDMDYTEASKYPGQIVFNAEDDIHYPTLTVAETLGFALKMKTPSERGRNDAMTREEWKDDFLKGLLRTFGIEHTKDTLVGNEFVRGVSGGERKRVSIAEVLVNRAAVTLWDSPSRGLDASTALEYTRSIRTITDIMGCTTFVSLYQAGNQVYDLFDKVCVIAAGQCIYWGPRADARPYFESMGFECPPGQNVADYLTGVTVLTERSLSERISSNPELKAQVPNTPEDFVRAYKKSAVCRRMEEELNEHLGEGTAKDERKQRTIEFKESVREDKAKSVGNKDPYTTGIWTQVKAATTRQYQLMWNDKASIAIKQGSSIVQSIILGSLFYMLPMTTAGIFTRGGTLFFCLLFNALLGMGEVTASFHGRGILAKHKSFSMYRPAALVLSQVVADFPILVAQISAFLLPIYFMSHLKRTASAFFTLWVIVYSTTLAVTAFFRLIGFSFSTFEGASGVSGIGIGVLILYTGYMIPQSSMKPWLSWTRWLNPLYYGFEAAMTNEFHNAEFACAQIVPSGPGYSTSGNSFACATAGAQAGQTFVNGDAYLKAALDYKHAHLWRNVGIILAFWIAFVCLTAFAVERLKSAGAEKSYLLYSRDATGLDEEDATDEEQGGIRAEKQPGGGRGRSASAAARETNEKMKAELKKHETVFTWQGVNYTVNVKDGTRQLLNNVQGYARPGQLLALMGSSGAGKTTLLDVISLRKDDGVVEGSILIDGRPLGTSFQRTTAYVSQMDIHDPHATVREALTFSALLRQPRDTPEAEKLAYVETVIDMLELHDIADAFIGKPGAGLGVEQRKRVTIGVELVSKPVLLFLDEPTSGLDGQSSFKIVQFLRKLADAGQCIICTIHQPSALLFSQFDQLLLLARGGNTVYMGPLGTNGCTMIDYFEGNGINCPPDANPAEFMIDVVSGPLAKGRDWADVWRKSPEHENITKEVKRLADEANAKPPSFEEDGLEFATPLSTQLKLVTARSVRSMWRSPDYLKGRFGLIVGSALLNGLSFLQIDNSATSLQNRLFSVFQGMFVAPGLLNQLQPHFIHNRMVFEAREKLSKMYGWFPFVIGEVVSEVPWILVSVTLYYVLWYFIVFPVGISTNAYHAGLMFVQLVLYYLFTLAFGQSIAAFSGNEQQAALINPIFIGLFASFSGVLVPYRQITAFWRYWIYYLNPWSYLLGGEVFFTMRNIPVVCSQKELTVFPPPSNQTCGQYMENFLSHAPGYIVDNSSTTECQYCQYKSGNDYLANVNLSDSVDGPRNIGISALYMMACFLFLFFAMWWRSRPRNKK